MWPIFIINLDRATERMAASRRIMEQHGLSFERMPACDWKSLTAADIERHVGPNGPLYAKRALTWPEIACYMSHIQTWRKIASGSAPGAFVFEDDFLLAPQTADLLEHISSSEPDWDMLKLFSDKPKALINPRLMADGYSAGMPRVIPMSTIAYAITRPAAAGFAANSIPFSFPVDLELKRWWKHGGLIKLVQPSPVDRRPDHESSSEIETARQDQDSRTALSRFMRNSLYQLAFKAGGLLHGARRSGQRRWTDRLSAAAGKRT